MNRTVQWQDRETTGYTRTHDSSSSSQYSCTASGKEKVRGGTLGVFFFSDVYNVYLRVMVFVCAEPLLELAFHIADIIRSLSQGARGVGVTKL
jgi:hypothetical protein